MFQQVEQLQDFVKAKDSELLRSHFAHRRVEAQNQLLRQQISSAEGKLKTVNQVIAAQKWVPLGEFLVKFSTSSSAAIMSR